MTLTRKIVLGVLIVLALRGAVKIGSDVHRFFIADEVTPSFERAVVWIDDPFYARFKDSVAQVDSLWNERMEDWVEGMKRNPDSVHRADSIEAAMSSAYTDKLINDLRQARTR